MTTKETLFTLLDLIKTELLMNASNPIHLPCVLVTQAFFAELK